MANTTISEKTKTEKTATSPVEQLVPVTGSIAPGLDYFAATADVYKNLALSIIAAAIINRTSTAKKAEEVAADAHKFYLEITRRKD